MLSLRTPTRPGVCLQETAPIPTIGSRRLELAGRTLDLAPGERLFREGSRATALYYVVSGTIKAEISSDRFEPRVIGYFQRGDVLGFTYSDTMLYTAVAVSPSRFHCYPAELLSRRFASDPSAAERMTRSSVSSLARMLALLAIVRSARPTQRVAAYLMSKVETDPTVVSAPTMIDVDIALIDLATLLGMSEADIESSLEELATSGLVRRTSATTIEIVDGDQLEALSLNTGKPSPAGCDRVEPTL